MVDFSFNAPNAAMAGVAGFALGQQQVLNQAESAQNQQRTDLAAQAGQRAQQQSDQQATLFDQGQQDRQAALAAAKQQQADLVGLRDKVASGAATIEDFTALGVAHPEIAAELKSAWDGYSQERKAADAMNLAKAWQAAKNNQTEVAAKMFEDHAIAAHNSGNKMEEDQARAMAAMVRADLPAAMATIGMALTANDPDLAQRVMGTAEWRAATPEEAKAYGATAGQINTKTGEFKPSAAGADRYKVVGNQIVDTGAPDGPKAVLTAPGQTETIYGPDGQPIMTRGPATSDLKLTDSQGKATGYSYRMEDANKTLNELEGQGTSLWNKTADNLPVVGNYMRSDDAQRFDQAKRDFLNAVLRHESGAVISPTEFESGDKQYFPQPGDSDAVVAQKRRNRETAIAELKASAGKGAETSLPPDASQSKGGGSGSQKGAPVVLDGYSIQEVE